MGDGSKDTGRIFVVNETAVTPDTDVLLQQILARYQLYYSIAGLVLGLVCMLGGIFLFIQGVTGAAEWYANVLGLESRISQAAPGAILFVVGLAVVYCTRYKFKHIQPGR